MEMHTPRDVFQRRTVFCFRTRAAATAQSSAFVTLLARRRFRLGILVNRGIPMLLQFRSQCAGIRYIDAQGGTPHLSVTWLQPEQLSVNRWGAL